METNTTGAVSVTERDGRFFIEVGGRSHDISSDPSITSPERLAAHVAGFKSNLGAPKAAPAAQVKKSALRTYLAIIDGDEAHGFEVEARDPNEARKKARAYMSSVVGHSRFDPPYKLNVRLA